jgi:uncharacterized membrane protein YfcA
LHTGKLILLGALVVLALFFIWRWWSLARAARDPDKLKSTDLAVGFGTNFFDTLGIGSFAPTTAIFKFFKRMPDEKIPGTLNVGHALPTVVQALVFITIINVGFTTLIAMIAAAVLGAWLGAGVVTRLPRRPIQIGMGVALLVAATLFILANLKLIPGGGDATALTGGVLVFAVVMNFILGVIMALGIGLYAPCLILCSLLGMNPAAAFPIMMGSCAFLMPSSGLRFVARGRYSLGASVGLALGGIPAVLLAAYVVKSLPLEWLRWLVIIVVLIAATLMLRSAFAEPVTGSVAAEGEAR